MIYIVIPVYNRIKFTVACLESLKRQTYRPFKVVVVDHGSIDGTQTAILKDYPHAVLLNGSTDMWWTGATNVGVQYALCEAKSSDYIMTLNNDLIVPSNYLQLAIDLISRNDKCIVGSVARNIQDFNDVTFSGIRWNRFTAKYRRVPLALGTFETDLLPGRGTLIPVSFFNEHGLFDDKRFPHYAADDDLSFRARSRGYKLLLDSSVYVLSHVNDRDDYTNMSLVRKFRTFCNSLVSIKSPNYLRVRWRWAIKNSRIPPLYFVLDVGRVLTGFLRSI